MRLPRLTHLAAAVMILGADLGSGTGAEAAAPRRPFPRHVAYTDGTIIPDHKTRAQLDQAVRTFYDAWKAAFVRQGCGAGRYYVALDGRPGAPSAATPISVSEGTGLGMLIVAHMAGHDPDAQAVFDGLHRFFRDHPSQHDPDLMAWRQLGDCASSSDRNSASDGDLNIAFGLLLAHAQWGSDGAVNYRAEALKVLAAIRRRVVHPTTKLVQMGDWVHPAYPLEYEAVRMSDLMPLQFRTFRVHTGDAGWNDTLLASLSLYNRMQQGWAPATGLVPDFAVNTPTLPRPADAGFVGEHHAGRYAYNACRVPWETALDYLLARGASALTITTRMMDWLQAASGGDIYKIYAGYELNGANFEGYNNVCFTGAFGVGAMVHPRYQPLLNRIWDDVAIATAGDLTDYYGATLRMNYLLTMSGNFWRP
jgi:endo-1,4-beta-D-glucanase Y